MKFIDNLSFLIRYLLIGSIVTLVILFFVPNSPMAFNWSSANDAWNFYQNINHSNNQNAAEGHHPFSYSRAVEKAGASVVSVKAFHQSRPRPATDGRRGDILVDVSMIVGSGVIFTHDGYIVTNYHVIAGSHKVAVHFSDGRKQYASIVGADKQNDIAVLKVNIDTPTVAELGNSAEVKTGDVVMAIGTPFGLFQNSVTLGIVSAIDHGPLYPRIQTDAAVNYGNSGGALINANGQVIGISSSKFSVETNDEIGINFGAPIDVVKEAFDDIKKHGRVVRNWLGVNLAQLNKAGHRHLNPGVEFGTGLLITGIEGNSPSEEAGFKLEDLIVRFGDHPVTNMVEFRKQYLSIPIGAEVEVEVIRNQKPITMMLKLRERPVK